MPTLLNEFISNSSQIFLCLRIPTHSSEIHLKFSGIPTVHLNSSQIHLKFLGVPTHSSQIHLKFETCLRHTYAFISNSIPSQIMPTVTLGAEWVTSKSYLTVAERDQNYQKSKLRSQGNTPPNLGSQLFLSLEKS